MTTTVLPASITDSPRNTVITGTVTAIHRADEITMNSELHLTLTTATGETIELAALDNASGVARNLDVAVGETITAAGFLRKRDGRVAAAGFRDEDDVLRYWVAG